MEISGVNVRRKAAGICVGYSLLGGLAATTIAAPMASAAPDCSAAGVASTVRSVTDSFNQYLSNHPDTGAAVTAAQNKPRSQAATDLRIYFNAHPQDYFDLRGILAPIGDNQSQCNTTGLTPDLESAYSEFIAG